MVIISKASWKVKGFFQAFSRLFSPISQRAFICQRGHTGRRLKETTYNNPRFRLYQILTQNTRDNLILFWVHCRITIHIGQAKKDMRNRIAWVIVKLLHQTPTRKETLSLMSKSITQDMAYRHSLMKYTGKYGVSRASRKHNKSRSYIYFWRQPLGWYVWHPLPVSPDVPTVTPISTRKPS